MVLLEMLTGKKTYSGDTVADTLAAVIKDAPSFNTLPADTPQPIRTLIRRCLEKDPRRRLRDIGEARVAIEDYLANPTAAPEAGPAVRAKSSRLPWAAFAIAIIVAGAAIPQPTSETLAMCIEIGWIHAMQDEKQIRNGCFGSARGKNGGIGHTTAKAYAHRHVEVEIFRVTETQAVPVMAT